MARSVQLHPQAKFDPIPPDLDLHGLVDKTPNFEFVTRISAAQIRQIGQQDFERLVLIHVIQGGRPLVIEKWNSQLSRKLFSAEWLEKNYDKKQENVRDITNQTDIPMTTGHYLRSMKQLANQWSPTNFRDERRQRLYLKDIDCPIEWHDRLQKILPPNLFYLNENVERKANSLNDDDMFDTRDTAAPAGDLMSSLPEQMRAQNLMCYIGHEGTYTAAHKEMCASLGQNIMVDASGHEHGEKPGSSIWFMTESKDRDVVREYFLSMLGHDLEIEKHFAQINAWKKAAFPVYVVEQKVGDFILVPPLAAHQVWNRGTRTIKVAWNRTTVETLGMALHEALPRARLVCRDEQYKNKAIIYFTLQKYYKQMVEMEETAETGLLGIGHDILRNSPRMKQMAQDFRALFDLFTEILVDEMFATKEKDVEFVEFDSNITCSYCRANIFNRFLTCKNCVRTLVNGDEDTYDVCMECYAMGRSCLCVSDLKWCEQWKWGYLVDSYEAWRSMVIKNDGFVDFQLSPLPLEISRKKTGKKAVAQICQEQLRRRPFKDPTKIEEPVPEVPSDPEPELDEEGRPKKKKYKRKKKKGDVYKCHVCMHKDYTYRVAYCTNPGCTEAYCYGVLYRAFDLMPQEVMQNDSWKCPKCLKICNCGSCRRAGHSVPYVPRSTLLGHDTRPIADDRSVESLVDFRLHNLSWVKNSGDETRALTSKRMQRLRQAADAEKANAADLDNEVAALPDSAVADALQQSIDEADRQLRGEAEMAGQNGADQHQNGGTSEDADLSVSGDQSAYPDPSMLRHNQRFGRGYYEPDDAPDKILFDPYQEPTAESLHPDEPEVSEYLRKQLRAAKRKARLDGDEDPDFEAPRSHHVRKRPRIDHAPTDDPQEDAMNNMDPALFAESTAMAADGMEVDASAEIDAPVDESFADEGEEGDGKQRMYPANVPALRHAKPKVSYAEAENGEEEFSELLIPKSQRPPKGINDFDPSAKGRDPLDLASAAIRAMTGTPGTSGQPKKTGTGRPRGRPRKNAAGPGSLPGPAPAVAPTPPEVAPKKRGRPTRNSNGAGVSRAATNQDDDDDIEAQLAKELADFDDNGDYLGQASSPEVEATPAPAKPLQPPRDSGKRAASVMIDIPSTSSFSTPPDAEKYMSMAERMKLKGKTFKIGQRKSNASATPDKATKPPSRPVSAVKKSVETPKAPSPSISTTLRKEKDIDEDYNPQEDEQSLSSNGSSPAVPSPAYDEEESSEEDFPASPKAAPKSVTSRLGPSSSKAAAQPKPIAKPTPKPAASKPAPAQPSRAPAPVKSGPTVVTLGGWDSDEEVTAGPSVVRLGDSEESEDGQFDGGVTSSSDSDEEDIPARAPPPVAQGRTAMRSRGGTVARGRGRGRGMARRGYST